MVEQDRKKWLFLSVVLCALLCAEGLYSTVPSGTTSAHPTVFSLPAGPENGSLKFIENRGQIINSKGEQQPDIAYTTAQGDVTVFFRHTGVSYVFAKKESGASSQSALHQPDDQQEKIATYRIDLDLINANPRAHILPSGQTSEYFNYYYAHCPQGISNVPAYTRLVYENIYDNIDLVFYSHNNGLKYDFIVKPGGNVADIAMRYRGADTPPVIKGGRLQVRGLLGTIEEDVPYSYQTGSTAENNQVAVGSRFVLRNGEIRFDVDSYNHNSVLVIDPGVLWATYLGGTLADGSLGVATDAAGNISVTGYTQSVNFPVTAGAIQWALANNSVDIFLARLASDGARQWITYYGGSGSDYSGDYRAGLAVDIWGNMIVTGHTTSTDFPVANAIQGSNGGDADGFILKLNSSGQRQWATYCGGSGSDYLRDVATDNNGAIYITGVTSSDNFPTGFAFQNSRSGLSDAFWAKLGSDGVPSASYYFGGTNTDAGNAIAVDNSGIVYIAGQTGSLNLPGSSNGFQNTYGGSVDAFIARFGNNGSLLWSTYYGGNGPDEATGLTTDLDGNVIAVGFTSSGNLAMSQGALQPLIGGGYDAFVIKLFTNGVRDWSTYYGGSGDDDASAIKMDSFGNFVLAGTTRSINFPLSSTTYQESNAGLADAFALRISGMGGRLLSTYFGGNNVDEGIGVAADNGFIIIAGQTSSSNLPVTIGAIQKINAGGSDAFIAKFGECSATVDITPAGLTTICKGSSLQLNAGVGYTAYLWSNGATTPAINVDGPGTYAVTVVGAGGCQATDSITINVNPIVLSEGDLSVCSGETAVLSAFATSTVGGLQYQWSPPDGLSCTNCKNPGVTITAPKVYTVTVTDAQGCRSSTTVSVRVNAPPAVQVSPDTTICVGNLVPLFASGGKSYRWSPRQGLTCDTCQGPLASLVDQKATTYYVQITGENGCTVIDSVTLYPRPIPRAYAGADTVICQGQSVQLSASGEGSYRWEPSEGLDCPTCARPKATLLADREYRLIVTDAYGCTSQDNIKIRVLPPQPLVSPQPRINFGKLDECESNSIRSAVITNTSQDNIDVRDIIFTDPAFLLVDKNGRPIPSYQFSVRPGTSDTLYCMFLPQQAGPASGNLTLRATPCNIEYTFELQGQKKSIAMTAGPATVDLGMMLACAAVSKDTTVVVRNTGGTALEVHASILPPFALIGSDGGIVQSVQELVKPGEVLNVNVRFTPLSQGNYTGDLSLAYRAGPCTDTTHISILGSNKKPQLQAAASSIIFPSLLGCEASTDTVLMITNTGDMPLDITGANDDANFRLNTLLPINIPPGESRPVSVQFRPSPPGVFNKKLTFTVEPCGLTLSVDLHGVMEGVSFTAPDTLDFADIVLCQNQTTEAVLLLANISGGSVQGKVLSVSSTGPFSSNIRTGDIISNGEVRDFAVHFTPQTPGVFIGKIDLLLEPCDIVKTVWLRGKAVNAALTAAVETVDMGIVPVLKTSDRTVVFRNTGTTEITISALDGVVAPFTILSTTPQLPARLQPDEELKVDVQYTGVTEGRDSIVLTAVADVPCSLSDKTKMIAETVNRKAPVITGYDFNFGSVQVTNTKRDEIVLRNMGTTSGTISHITFELGSDADFSIDSSSWDLPATLAVDGEFPVTLRFRPSVAGPRSARLRIETESGILTYTILGTGVDKPHGTAVLMIPASIEADVEARGIHIPIYLQDVQRLAEVNPTMLELTIGFNETVFKLTDIAGCAGCQRIRETSQNSEYKEVTFKVLPPFASGTVLFELVGDVLLGNSDYTDFVISEVQWQKENGIDMTTIPQNGRLTVLGICHNGGDRLLEQIGPFGITSINPNPSGGRVEITINTVEYGETHLEIYSIYGQRAYSRTWVPTLNAEGNAFSTETIVLDNELPSGIYQVVLTSPARTTSRQLIIAK